MAPSLQIQGRIPRPHLICPQQHLAQLAKLPFLRHTLPPASRTPLSFGSLATSLATPSQSPLMTSFIYHISKMQQCPRGPGLRPYMLSSSFMVLNTIYMLTHKLLLQPRPTLYPSLLYLTTYVAFPLGCLIDISNLKQPY